MKSQLQLYRESEKRLAERNLAFLDAVNDGMTSAELGRLIERRPEVWGMYASWIEVLRERESKE